MNRHSMPHRKPKEESSSKWLMSSSGSSESVTATFTTGQFCARISSRQLIEWTVLFQLVWTYLFPFSRLDTNLSISDGGRKLVYGTDSGIYLSERWPKDKSAKPRRMLDVSQVTQIDTLEEYQLLLVLSNKTLSSYPMETLEAVEGQSTLAKRPKKIQGHANFFKAGIGLGRHLVCSVKTSALSTTIKVYEPMDNLAKGKKKSAVSKMFQSGQDTLKPFKVRILFTYPTRQ